MKDEEKSKNKEGFILLAETTKEVCTALTLLYLTNTEKEETGKLFWCREEQHFFAKFVFPSLCM